jgi:predicted enzyme related to lactoylglutathione lyase
LIDVRGVDNVLFRVGDFKRARNFYEAALGLQVKFEAGEIGMAGYWLGQERPGLFLQTGAGTPRLWLEVKDARFAAARLRGRGINLTREPFEIRTGWTVEFEDPAGNVIGLTDYTKAPRLARPDPES